MEVWVGLFGGRKASVLSDQPLSMFLDVCCGDATVTCGAACLQILDGLENGWTELPDPGLLHVLSPPFREEKDAHGCAHLYISYTRKDNYYLYFYLSIMIIRHASF